MRIMRRNPDVVAVIVLLLALGTGLNIGERLTATVKSAPYAIGGLGMVVAGAVLARGAKPRTRARRAYRRGSTRAKSATRVPRQLNTTQFRMSIAPSAIRGKGPGLTRPRPA